MLGFSPIPAAPVRAWYTYTFAAEVFSACALAIFLPITLERMAREVGFIAPDLVKPCIDLDETASADSVCRAKILGTWVDTASFSMYVKSVAVAIQALCIISIGPLADSAYWRKRLLGSFALLGSCSGITFFALPSSPTAVGPVVAAFLMITGNLAYAVGTVCSNAFLPVLAREDAAVIAALKDVRPEGDSVEDGASSFGNGPEISNSGDGLEGSRILPGVIEPVITAISSVDIARADPDRNVVSEPLLPSAKDQYASLLSLTTSRISSTGTAIGFFSGVTVLALLLIPVTVGGGSTASLRIAIGLSGVWWGIFLVPAWLGLSGGIREQLRGESRSGWVGKGWKRVGNMIKISEMRKIPNLFMFLLAWIFLSDGFHTTTYTAILYASSTLHMSAPKVILIGILVQLAAVFSSLVAPRVQRFFRCSNLRFLLYIVLLAQLLPIYACLGLLLPWGGLRTEAEMYVAAVWFGMLYGPFNSYSRAVYAELIPPGHESSFFSLFSLTDKSASFFGPLVVGVIADATGNIRLGFVFLLVLLALPVPVLLRVNMQDGSLQAQSWTKHGSEELLDDAREAERLLNGQ